MRLLQILRLRLRSLFQRAAAERELEDEIRFHLDLQIQENLAAGMSPTEAQSAARRQFGHPTQRKEECRDARKTRWIEDLLDDVRYAIRGLRRDPLLALAATLTLAISIGANTTVFSIADSILIRPLPYPGSERIDWITDGAAPDYYRVREGNRIFEEVGAFDAMTINWTGVDQPEQLDAAMASASFFRVMGTQPMLGRYFTPEEEGTKSPAVAVISYEFWRNSLGSDPHVLGTTIGLNRLPHMIVGVMPQGFDFPRGTQIWIPLDIDEASGRIISPNAPIRIISIVARRKPGIIPEQAEAEMHWLTLAVRAEYLRVFQKTGFRTDLVIQAIPLQEHLTGSMRPALLMLTGAVGLVLLIACLNLATLLLARAETRHRELAVRLALGSYRSRIIRQMLTESLVIALPGGAAGIALAWLAVRALDAVKPAILVRYPAISMDLRVLIFTIALTLATSLIFGIVPALSAAGTRIQEALQSAGLTHSSGRAAVRLRRALVIGELGISLVLLIGAGLLARSFVHLAHTELGFRSDHLLTFRVTPIGPFDRNYLPFFEQVLDRLNQMPGARATLSSNIPLRGGDFYPGTRIQVAGRPLVPLNQRPPVNFTIVSPGFFHTLEIPLKGGRIFDAHDFVKSAEIVPGMVPAESVVVNEAFVRRFFPGEDPLGRRIEIGPDNRVIHWTIVGVVGDIRGAALGADPPSMIYRCTCSGARLFYGTYMIRTNRDPQAMVRTVERQVRTVDRDQSISDVKTMDQRKDAALAPERFQLILIGTFAFIAIFLAVAGVYATMSYLVARRTREIGIRMAMGARPADVFRMIVTETTVLVFWAVAIGLGGAWALTRYIRFVLFGVTNLDPVTFSFAPILLAIVVLIASLAPARRALQIDPMKALREE